MEIRGATLSDFRQAVAAVGWLYDDNVRLQRDSKVIGNVACRARIDVHDSRGLGARWSWTGRRGPWACWHAYRDVLTALFTTHPEARVRTALAFYRGKESFEELYPETAYLNAGSVMSPVQQWQLCDCDERSPLGTITRSGDAMVVSFGRAQ